MEIFNLIISVLDERGLCAGDSLSNEYLFDSFEKAKTFARRWMTSNEEKLSESLLEIQPLRADKEGRFQETLEREKVFAGDGWLNAKYAKPDKLGDLEALKTLKSKLKHGRN